MTHRDPGAPLGARALGQPAGLAVLTQELAELALEPVHFPPSLRQPVAQPAQDLLDRRRQGRVRFGARPLQ